MLVKNINNALPLTKSKMLGIYGYSPRSRDYYELNSVPGPLQDDYGALDLSQHCPSAIPM